MPSISEAQAKWERKTANAGSKWDAMKQTAISHFANSPKYASLGVRPGPQTVAAYTAGMNGATGAQLQAGVQGKGAKWAEKFRLGFGA